MKLRLQQAKGAVSVKMLAPETEGIKTLPADREANTVKFTVPHLEVYKLLVVD